MSDFYCSICIPYGTDLDLIGSLRRSLFELAPVYGKTENRSGCWQHPERQDGNDLTIRISIPSVHKIDENYKQNLHLESENFEFTKSRPKVDRK